MNEYVVTWLKCTNDTFPLEPLLSCVLHAKTPQICKEVLWNCSCDYKASSKGLKYNPDAHWSSAFYKGLNKLQHTDHINAVTLNRDDASRHTKHLQVACLTCCATV